jgi:hypothetical protein
MSFTPNTPPGNTFLPSCNRSQSFPNPITDPQQYRFSSNINHVRQPSVCEHYVDRVKAIKEGHNHHAVLPETAPSVSASKLEYTAEVL